MPAPGDLAPDFTLPRNGGGMLSLSALRPGKVVLFFYPGDDTPTCTLEARDFSARAADFRAAGTTVVGLSRDSVSSHDRFCRKHALGLALVSDEDGAACAAFGTWGEKTTFGRTYMGIIRSTFLIDGAGRIARVWKVERAKGHAAEVLEAARAL